MQQKINSHLISIKPSMFSWGAYFPANTNVVTLIQIVGGIMINQDWLLGFFFILSDAKKGAELYFACFQEGLTVGNAHQVVIAHASDQSSEYRKVAYIVDPADIDSFDDFNLERFCRIAVGQFLSKLPLDNFLAKVLPLDLKLSPWPGTIAPMFDDARWEVQV